MVSLLLTHAPDMKNLPLRPTADHDRRHAAYVLKHVAALSLAFAACFALVAPGVRSAAGSDTCSNPPMLDGSVCDDGNACTRRDACEAGVCVGDDPVVCSAVDQCHGAGVCDPGTGLCSNPALSDGTPCDDGDAGTQADGCIAGVCRGGALTDSDGDGIPDMKDDCVAVYDPAQLDADGNGVGDACECTARTPGRCLSGGGGATTTCLLEFNPNGPVKLNAKHTAIVTPLACADGDPACDRDGNIDGQCTFGVSVCLANLDPRYAHCTPADVTSVEVTSPSAAKTKGVDRANALAIEQTLSEMRVEIVRAKKVITPFPPFTGVNRCSPLVDVVVPAPTGKAKSVRKTIQVRAIAGKRNDVNVLDLECDAVRAVTTTTLTRSSTTSTTTSTTLKPVKTTTTTVPKPTTTTTTLPPLPTFSDATTACIAQATAAKASCTSTASLCQNIYYSAFPNCFAAGAGAICAATCENQDVACELPRVSGCSACQNAWTTAGARCHGDSACMNATTAAFIACQSACSNPPTIAQCRATFSTCLSTCSNL